MPITTPGGHGVGHLRLDPLPAGAVDFHGGGGGGAGFDALLRAEGDPILARPGQAEGAITRVVAGAGFDVGLPRGVSIPFDGGFRFGAAVSDPLAHGRFGVRVRRSLAEGLGFFVGVGASARHPLWWGLVGVGPDLELGLGQDSGRSRFRGAIRVEVAIPRPPRPEAGWQSWSSGPWVRGMPTLGWSFIPERGPGCDLQLSGWVGASTRQAGWWHAGATLDLAVLVRLPPPPSARRAEPASIPAREPGADGTVAGQGSAASQGADGAGRRHRASTGPGPARGTPR